MKSFLVILAFLICSSLAVNAEEKKIINLASPVNDKTLIKAPPIQEIKIETIKKTDEIKTAIDETLVPELSESEIRYQQYRTIVAKSFESVEEAEWPAALDDISNVIKYFQDEKTKNPKETEINVYIGLAEILKKYVETGMEIDKDVDVPDFDKISKLSEENKNHINQIKNKSKDKFLEACFELIEQYIDDDLLYMEESKKYQGDDQEAPEDEDAAGD